MDRPIPTPREAPPPTGPGSEAGSACDPVERLAEEYLDRLRRGHRPAVEEFVARLPGREDDVRELFSALALVEDLKPVSSGAESRPEGGPLDRDGLPIDRLGDYRLLRELGRGGMGVVYEAEQESLGRRVALKILSPTACHGPQQIRRFRREARAAARLHHTNIVPVFGVGEHDGTHYYAMQYIRGVGLDQVLRDVGRLRRPAPAGAAPAPPGPEAGRGEPPSATEVARSLVTGRFAPASPVGSDPDDAPPGGADAEADADPPPPPPDPAPPELSSATESTGAYARAVARIGAQAAEGLEYAHQQGLVHRDVKPSNLLLDAHGTVWVADFGLVKAVDDDDLTHTGDLVGTLRYMAPERFRGECTPLSDVYSLGLTLYELLALRPAFEAPDRHHLIHRITHEEPPRLRQHDPDLPRDLETIVHKAIERAPLDRYPSAGLLAEDLRRWLRGEPIRARPSGPAERLVKWARRRPALATLGIVSALAVAGLLATLSIGYAQVSRGLHRERRASSFQRIALAERAWSGNDVGRAEDLLDGCHPEFRGWEWHYLKRLCHGDRTTLRVHDGLEPNAVALSPDGRRLATAGPSGAVVLRDAGTGRAIRRLGSHPGGVYALAFSRDGTRLASGGHDGVATVWRVDAGGPAAVARLEHEGPVLGVAFSPDGSRVASATGHFWEMVGRGVGGGELVLWEPGSGRPGRRLGGHDGSVHAVAFSPDGSRLASAGADGTARIWDPTTGALLRTLGGHADVVMDVAFDPDGARLATAGLDGAVRVWDAAGGDRLLTLREPDEKFFAVALSPDGRHLAAAGRNWAVTLWDPETGDLGGHFRGHSREVTDLAFGPDGRLASAGFDGLVKLWDATRAPEALVLPEPDGPVVAVAFGPDGRLASVAEGGPVRVRGVATGRADLTLSDGGPFASLAYRADGSAIAAGGRDSGALTVWDAADGRVLLHLAAHAGAVSAVAYGPDGSRVASGGRDRVVKVWDAETGRLVSITDALALPVTGLAFSPDGRALAASTGDVPAIDHPGEVTLLDPETGRVVRALRGHGGGVSDLAFSPDGRRLASASWDRTVGVWDVASGDRLHSLQIRGLIVWSVAYHPDGRRLVAADNIGRLTFWDAESGLEVLTLRGHMDRVFDLAISPDGRRLASAGRDRTARIWDATPMPAAARGPLGVAEPVPSRSRRAAAAQVRP